MEDKLVNGRTPVESARRKAAANRPGRQGSGLWPTWMTYAFAIVLTITALWVRLIMKIELGDGHGLILFMIPIILSAYFGGLGPGLVSTALAAVGLDYLFIPRTFSFSIARSSDLVRWLILIISGTLVSALSEALHRSRRRAEVSKKQLSLITNAVPALISYIDTNYRYRSVNQTYEQWFGLKQEHMVGRHVREVFGEVAWDKARPYMELAVGGEEVFYEQELLFQHGGPRWVHVNYTPDHDNQGQVRGFITMVQDISMRRRAEKESEVAVDFLRLVNDSRHKKDMIPAAVTFFRQQSGCESIGVRLHEEEDYPYYEVHGFPPEFVLAENSLCSRSDIGEVIRDSAGNPVLDCMCGNVICGRFDPSKPFFTEGGSFWTNSTSELLANTTESDRQALTRNRCYGEGYESMALIALRVGENRLGLLQLNDRRKGRFSPEDVALWERLAGYLAVALAKFQAEELLCSSEEVYRSLFDNMLNGFAYCRMLFSQDQPLDFIYLAVNDAFTTLTGLKDVVGNKATEVIPGIRESDPELFEIYGRVALSGKPERFEMYVAALRMWFSVSVYSPRKEHFVAVFDGITERKLVEESLQKSEERFRSYFNLGLIGMTIASPTKGILEVNDQICKILGYDRSELVQLNWADLTHPDDVSADIAYLNRVLSGKLDGYELDKRFIRKDGHIIYAAISVKCLRRSDGSVDYFVALIQDISERKRIEAREHLALDVLKHLNQMGGTEDTIRVILQMVKKSTGIDAVGIRLNRGDDVQYLVQDGFSNDFLLTENTPAVHGPDGGPCWDKDGNLNLERACRLVISGQTDPANPLFTPGGSFWTNDSFPALDLPSGQDPRLYPRNGCIDRGFHSGALIPLRVGKEIIGLLQLNDRRKDQFTPEMILFFEGLATSIGTAFSRKRAEKELNEIAQRLQLATYSARLGIWDWDITNNIAVWDDRMLELYGLTPATFPGGVEAWQNSLHPEDRDKTIEEYRAALRGDKEWDIEFRVLHPTGTVKHIRANGIVIRDSEGNPIRMLGINYDVSGQRKLEEQLRHSQKMEGIGTLAGGVAHDFNNILTAIIGYGSMAQKRLKDDATIQRYIQVILEAAKRAEELTKRLLAFSRKQVIEPVFADLNEIVRNIEKMLRRLLREEIELRTILSSGELPVLVDVGQMEQVLINLAANAQDAIPDGGHLVIQTDAVNVDSRYAESHLFDNMGMYAVLTVSDTGVGMDHGTKENIFEPFFTTKEVGKGTGLGLSMVYGIIKQHNGNINVYSEVGKGTTFKIYLPLARTKKEAISKPIKTALPRGKGETIIIAEDELQVRESIRLLLQENGYEMIEAENGEDAVRKFKENRGTVSLVLLDVIMPVKNGREANEEIKGIEPGVKTIFMSGYTDDIISKKGILEEGFDFISKPIDPGTLMRKIREVLNR